MFDLQLGRICDHRIFDERLTLQGASPNYFSVLQYKSNGDPVSIDIRDWASTNGITRYQYSINGITNWSLSSDGTQINFNHLGLGGPGTGAASFVDGSTMIYPSKIYVANYYALDTACPLHVQPGPQYAPIQKDINLDDSGQLSTVSGSDKIKQPVIKALLTALGTNPFHPEYGSWLSTFIGKKFDLLAQFTLQQSVQNAVDYLIQQQQLSTVYIPPEETIFRVSSVNIFQDPATPTTVTVSLKVTTGTYQDVSISLGVSL